jgi:hypothetical protein
MPEAMRWLLAPIAAAAVWCGVIACGLLASNLLDWLCPPELVVSGACTAPWHPPAFEALVLCCVALLALGVVLVPAAVAPRGGLGVAIAAYAWGAVYAGYVASRGGMWDLVAASAISGSLALGWAWSHGRPVAA